MSISPEGEPGPLSSKNIYTQAYRAMRADWLASVEQGDVIRDREAYVTSRAEEAYPQVPQQDLLWMRELAYISMLDTYRDIF